MEDILKEDICCPVCTTTMVRSFTLTLTSPQVGGRQAMFCKHGHGVCSPCTGRLAGTCPVCRSPTSWSRCLPLERARQALVLQGRVEVEMEEEATTSLGFVASQLQLIRAARGSQAHHWGEHHAARHQAEAARAQEQDAIETLPLAIMQEIEVSDLKVQQFLEAVMELWDLVGPVGTWWRDLVEESLAIPQDRLANMRLGPGVIEEMFGEDFLKPDQTVKEARGRVEEVVREVRRRPGVIRGPGPGSIRHHVWATISAMVDEEE